LHEISNFTVDPDTLATLPVGDSREVDAIVVGVNPQNITSEWSIKGRFLSGKGDLETVIGDSVSQSMFYPHPNISVVLSNPLVEGISFKNTTFNIVGICIDPLNNGQVAFVPLDKLENATGIPRPNLLLIKLNDFLDRNSAIAQIKSIVQTADSNLEVLDLRGVIEQNASFLSSAWQTIMLLPLFTLSSAALCLVGYMILAVDEQRQEFGILRAVGVKPRIIIAISAIQSAIVIISSFGIGISLGVITTLLILMANPLVTSVAIAEIALWLTAALIAMFLLSLCPAFKLAKTSILKIMT
jgi:ABC-type antimicrobial peptide transport system permease subunit